MVIDVTLLLKAVFNFLFELLLDYRCQAQSQLISFLFSYLPCLQIHQSFFKVSIGGYLVGDELIHRLKLIFQYLFYFVKLTIELLVNKLLPGVEIAHDIANFL